MSHYIERFCEKHGTWDQDVDHPHDECPTCEEAGMAPSQVAAKELTDLRERLAAAEAERDQVRADAASQLKAMQTIIDTMEGSVREVAAERDALRLERDRMAVNRMWMRLCDLHRRDLIPEGPCVACDAERRLESNVALRADNAALRAALEAVEWGPVNHAWTGAGWLSKCPWCGRLDSGGHAPDCARQRALGLAPAARNEQEGKG